MASKSGASSSPRDGTSAAETVGVRAGPVGCPVSKNLCVAPALASCNSQAQESSMADLCAGSNKAEVPSVLFRFGAK